MTWQLWQKPNGTVHCVPVNDMREHVREPDCWCDPVDVGCWAHNSLDRREEFENGRKPS